MTDYIIQFQHGESKFTQTAAAVTEFAGQATAVAKHEVNSTFFIGMLIQGPHLI